jgi:hypothetical protein
MLDRGQRPRRSERIGLAVSGAAREFRRGEHGEPPQAEAQASERRLAVQPRVVVAVTLIAAAVVWSIVRGLEFYGLSPVNLLYSLDQPPLLLGLVAGWLWYRSYRR